MTSTASKRGPPPGFVTAREYGDQCSPPIGKSGMSRLLGLGLPHVVGADDHGRICKFIDPVAADQWRAANCTPKIDGRTGEMRGAPDIRPLEQRGSTPPASTAPALSKPGPGADAGTGAGGVEQLSVALRIQNARATEAEEKARSSTLNRLKAEGRLIDRDAAIQAHLTFVGQVTSLLDRMAASGATAVANAIGRGVTEHEAYLALRGLSEALREDLHTRAVAERDRLGVADLAETG